ncbi:MAG TPA: hypothetical protein VMF67_18455 [Rhizomicrobium sp.]|nr:hypothetical protein [Rhizomicrobium sp.]
MSEHGQTACPICEEEFEEGDIVIAYRPWPQDEVLGHAGCVAAISLDEEPDEEDDDD